MKRMDNTIEKQLVRQLKILNFWITTFGVLMLLALGIIGFFLFQTVMFVKSTSDKLTTFQQTTTEKLDVKKQFCDGTDAFSNFVRSTGACQ